MNRVELQPLTDEEMQARGLTDADMWMVKHGEDVYGPYELATLKAHAHEHRGFYATLHVSPVAHEDWKPFFDAGPFKRRPPQLVAASSLAVPERFWAVQKGTRQGPFSQLQVQELIGQGQLIASDLISADEGGSWQRLFELKYFESTRHDASHLPECPAEESFPLEVPVEERPAAVEGLVSLAYLGKANGSAVKLEELVVPKARVYTESEIPEGHWLQAAWVRAGLGAACAVVLVVGSVKVFSPSRPGLDDIELQDDPNAVSVDVARPGQSLLDDDEPQRAPAGQRRVYHGRRSPSSAPSPRAMYARPGEIGRYSETHDDYNAANDNQETGLYPDENTDGTPVAENSLVRQPSSKPEANDDGYRMEDEQVDSPPAQVEEVGDF